MDMWEWFDIVFSLVVYIVFSFALYRFAEKTGYEKKWVAFIPLFQNLVFTDYMEDKVADWLKGKVKIVMVYAPLVAFMMLMGSSVVLGLLFNSDGSALWIPFLIMLIGFYVLLIPLWALSLYVYIKFLRLTFSDKFVSWLICLLLFGNLTVIVALFKFEPEEEHVENKEDGKDEVEKGKDQGIENKEEDGSVYVEGQGEEEKVVEEKVVEEKEEKEAVKVDESTKNITEDSYRQEDFWYGDDNK